MEALFLTEQMGSVRKSISYNSINLFDLLPNTIWTDIYNRKRRYRNVEELYNLNSETRETLLYMLKFRRLKFFHGIVYASGIGEYGVLGDGRTDFHYEITPISIDINDKIVIQVSSGNEHSLFLCEDGSVYASGWGKDGRLGDGRTDDHYEGTPIPIDTANMGDKIVIQVSAGHQHSLFLCEDGSVYASGNGFVGRLGDGRADTFHKESTPIQIDTANMGDKRVIQVSSGNQHSLFLCEDGSVFASGNGSVGRLGDGRTDTLHEESTPIPIDTSNMEGKRETGLTCHPVSQKETGLTCHPVSQKVIQVSAGLAHSLFLCEDGSVFASGWGKDGILGDGRDDNHNEGTPIQIDTANMGDKRVIQVSAGHQHSLFLCEDGSVYASGRGSSGQLGDGRTDPHNEGTPIQIDTANMQGKRVIQISAGTHHSLFLCEDGSVYACGNGVFGVLGDGRTDQHSEGTPIPIDTANMQGKIVIQVSASEWHSLFLT